MQREVMFDRLYDSRLPGLLVKLDKLRDHATLEQDLLRRHTISYSHVYFSSELKDLFRACQFGSMHTNSLFALFVMQQYL